MKKLFMKKAPKEASTEENKEYLESIGVTTHKSSRERKFGGFSDYAREVAAKNKKDYNSRDNAVSDASHLQQQQETQVYGSGGNPYARQREQRQYNQAVAAGQEPNPYGNAYLDQSMAGGNPNSNSYASAANPHAQAASAPGGGGNPYSNMNSGSGNPYGAANGGNPYGAAAPTGGNSYSAAAAGGGAGGNPYGAASSSYNPGTGGGNPYGSAHSNPHSDAASIAPSTAPSTAAPSNARDQLFGGRDNYRKKEFDFGPDDELDELNGLPDQSNELDELNGLPDKESKNPYGETFQEKTQEELEDEEVEDLRQQIRFTKKESLSSTQNTLRLAAEAEASGRNALGMLGAQGERIANTERSLALAKNQSKIATEKSAELARLNRSIFVPNVGNPFTSKRRLQEKEARIKSEYLQEQVAREHRRVQAFESERRVLDGLNANGVTYSETAMKHKKEQMRNSEGRKKFQFEADSEDDEIEDELELNLEGISNAAGRMKNLALGMGEEVESQNKRLERVTRQTDELDVDVHLNAARLAAIK